MVPLLHAAVPVVEVDDVAGPVPEALDCGDIRFEIGNVNGTSEGIVKRAWAEGQDDERGREQSPRTFDAVGPIDVLLDKAPPTPQQRPLSKRPYEAVRRAFES